LKRNTETYWQSFTISEQPINYDAKGEIQKVTDNFSTKIDALIAAKEKNNAHLIFYRSIL